MPGCAASRTKTHRSATSEVAILSDNGYASKSVARAAHGAVTEDWIHSNAGKGSACLRGLTRSTDLIGFGELIRRTMKLCLAAGVQMGS